MNRDDLNAFRLPSPESGRMPRLDRHEVGFLSRTGSIRTQSGGVDVEVGGRSFAPMEMPGERRLKPDDRVLGGHACDEIGIRSVATRVACGVQAMPETFHGSPFDLVTKKPTKTAGGLSLPKPFVEVAQELIPPKDGRLLEECCKQAGHILPIRC